MRRGKNAEYIPLDFNKKEPLQVSNTVVVMLGYAYHGGTCPDYDIKTAGGMSLAPIPKVLLRHSTPYVRRRRVPPEPAILSASSGRFLLAEMAADSPVLLLVWGQF